MTNTSKSLLSYIRIISGPWRDDPRDDAQLLARYSETRDERAFATLLWRHASLVWHTCTRVLGDGPDAEDACQATFLALSRKASKLRADTLAGWLHRVARQTALNIDAGAKRRQNLEQKLRSVTHPKTDEHGGHELLYATLDKELMNLPERLRVPLLLHYLEGKTQVEMARILGCARTVVQYRLSKAEATLRKRLERQGLTLAIGSLATLLSGSVSTPALPACLIENTTRAATAFQAGCLTNGAADAAQKLLRSLAVEGMVRNAWWAVLVGIFCLGVGGIGLTIWKGVPGHSDVTMPETPNVLPKSHIALRKSLVDIYGDSLPEGALARLGTIRLRNTEMMVPIAFAPDGKAVIARSMTYDRLFVWEFPDGRCLQRFGDRKETSRSWGFSGVSSVSMNGKLVAIATEDGDVELVDLSAGKKVGQLANPAKGNRIFALAFLSDDKTLASGMQDDSVRFWDLATKKEIHRQKIASAVPKREIKAMAFTPDLQTVAIGRENGIVQLMDLKSGISVSNIKVSETGNFMSLAFSANGRKLAAAGSDGQVTLWEVATRKELLRLMGCKSLQTVRLSPDEKILAGWGNEREKDGGSGVIHLWNAENGAILHTMTGPQGFAFCMAFSPDSKALVTGGMTQTLKFWDMSTGKSLQNAAGHEYGVNAVAFTPDGKSLASGNGVMANGENSPTPILIWDIGTCKLRRQQVERNPGERLEGILTYTPREKAEGACITYSSDGTLLASMGKDKENRDVVWLWDAITGKRIQALEGSAVCVAFASDNKMLAIGNHQSKTIELREVNTGKQLRVLETYDLEGLRGDGISALAFTSDGRKLASAHPAGIAIWDAINGKQLHSLIIPLQGESESSVSSLMFSPDGRILVSGGQDDKTLRLWEVASGQELLKIPLECGAIQVAISPDGKLIASASEDETIRLWDVDSGRQLHQFSGSQGRVRSVAFSPNGRTLASGNEDTTVLIWDVTPWGKRENRSSVLSSNELQACWSALADADAAKAYHALWKLVGASDQSVSLLSERLRSTPLAPRQRIRQLLTDLDSDDFQVRNRARDELQKMDEEAEPFLRQALKDKPSPEQRRSVEELLNKWQVNNFSKLLRRLRGVAVLEHIDTRAARQALQKLADASPCGEIGEEAKAALQRLNRKSH